VSRKEWEEEALSNFNTGPIQGEEGADRGLAGEFSFGQTLLVKEKKQKRKPYSEGAIMKGPENKSFRKGRIMEKERARVPKSW